MKLGLREANQRFSRAIKAVKAGREVVLTERGKAIAVIRPLRGADSFHAALERLAAEGRLRLAAKPKPIPRRGWQPVKLRRGSVTAALRRDRDAR